MQIKRPRLSKCVTRETLGKIEKIVQSGLDEGYAVICCYMLLYALTPRNNGRILLRVIWLRSYSYARVTDAIRYAIVLNL